LRAGLLQRALVIGVDLPIVGPLLETYHRSGMLARRVYCDPFHPETDGFHPGEAGAAVLLENLSESASSGHPQVLGYWANSDAANLVGSPADGARLTSLYLTSSTDLAAGGHRIAHVCPHANGTQSNRLSERSALAKAFPGEKPSLHLLKPFIGHCVGASGLVETVLLAHYLRQGSLPPNLAGLTPPESFVLPRSSVPAKGVVLNAAISMGGHNALIALGC
jgi:3-oxoacyl-[acyl-carrier-protein] synthase II